MITDKKRRLFPILGLSLAATLFFASTAAASAPGFRSTLPRFQEHTTVVAGRKDSEKSSNAYVHINGGSKNGWYWVDRRGNGQVTDRKFVAGGKEHTLPYYYSSWTGDTSLRGHQEWWGPGVDEISGWVNFG